MYYEAIKIKTIEYDHLVHIYCISCDDIPRYTGQARSIFSKRRKYAKGEGFSNDIIKNFYLNAKKVRMEEVASVVVKDKEGQIQANKLEHDFIIKLETSTEFGGANINYGGAPLKAPEWEKAYLETPDYRVLIEKKDEPGIIFDYDPRQASKEFDISLPDLKRLSTEYAQVYNQVYCQKYYTHMPYPIEALREKTKRSLAKSGPVYVFNLKQELMFKYESRKEAAKKLKTTPKTIREYLDTNNTIGHFYLRRTPDFNKVLVKNRFVNGREVVKRDITANEDRATFKNMKAAAEAEGMSFKAMKNAIQNETVFNDRFVYALKKV